MIIYRMVVSDEHGTTRRFHRTSRLAIQDAKRTQAVHSHGGKVIAPAVDRLKVGPGKRGLVAALNGEFEEGERIW